MFKARVNVIFNSLFVSAILLFSAGMLNAQDKGQQQKQQMQTQETDLRTQNASDLSQDLTAKLNLTKDQANQVKDILVSYEDDVEGAAQAGKTDLSSEKATTNSAIEEILDESQKANWENVKTDFWTSVDSKVNTNPTEQKSQDTY